MKKIRNIILWSLIILGLVSIIATFIFDIPWIIPTIGAIILIICIVILLFIFNKRFYNVFLFVIPFAVIGLIFKQQHWPGAGALITLGMGISSLGSLIIAFRLIIEKKTNIFITRLGFAITLVLAIDFAGAVLKMQHWPGGGFMVYLGTALFILCLLALVFLLPNANYHKWSAFDKKYFFRAMIFPLLFIFCFTIWMNIYRKVDFKSRNYIPYYWNMKDYKLDDKEGL